MYVHCLLVGNKRVAVLSFFSAADMEYEILSLAGTFEKHSQQEWELFQHHAEQLLSLFSCKYCIGLDKNRFNVANVFHHKEDYGMDAEHNYFATSNEKGPCDVTGGVFKCAASRAS